MRSILFTVVSFFVVLIILNTGYYKEWVQVRPSQYWDDFLQEKDDTNSLEDIRKARYGAPYIISTRIRDLMKKNKISDGVILLEPNSYYRDSLHMTLRMPEPSVLYYYTGLKAVWMNDPPVVVSKARYLLRVSKRGVNLDEIKSQQQLQQIIDTYKKYPPVL
jgi:hypothetical protein